MLVSGAENFAPRTNANHTLQIKVLHGQAATIYSSQDVIVRQSNDLRAAAVLSFVHGQSLHPIRAFFISGRLQDQRALLVSRNDNFEEKFVALVQFGSTIKWRGIAEAYNAVLEEQHVQRFLTAGGLNIAIKVRQVTGTKHKVSVFPALKKVPAFITANAGKGKEGKGRGGIVST